MTFTRILLLLGTGVTEGITGGLGGASVSLVVGLLSALEAFRFLEATAMGGFVVFFNGMTMTTARSGLYSFNSEVCRRKTMILWSFRIYSQIW